RTTGLTPAGEWCPAKPDAAHARQAPHRDAWAVGTMSKLRQLVAENIYARIFRSPHWRVGWRRLSGPDLWDTQSLQGTRSSLLPDPRTRFFADPIAIEHDGRTVLFVEDFDHDRQKGVISAVQFPP